MEKMEELKPTPRGLNLQDGWEQQINCKAQRLDAQDAMDKQRKANAIAQRHAQKRINWILRTVAMALALITAGGIYLGHAGELPLGISVAVEISGAALLSFTIGLLVGRRQRR